MRRTVRLLSNETSAAVVTQSHTIHKRKETMATLEKELSSLSQSSASSEQQYPFQRLTTRPSVGTAISKHRVLSFAVYDMLAVWLPSLIAVACRYPHGLSG